MDTGIIIALVAGIGGTLTGIAAIISAILLNRKTVALLEYRMNQVEKKLDEHNGYAKLFSNISAEISAIRTDIEVIKTRIMYLERDAAQ